MLPLPGCLDVLMQSSTIKHLLIAAESGDAAAQFNLGVLYDSRLDDNGYAIKGNRAEAMKWLLAAAEQGLPRAQSKLAEMYAGGRATSEDFIYACAWFLLATTSLRGIHRHRAQSGYARISARLTPAQLATAKRLAGDWKPRKLNNIAPDPVAENGLAKSKCTNVGWKL
jgi:TPR repeat protein